MATVPPGDPRAASPEYQGGVTPIVAVPRSGPSWIWVAVGMGVAAILLFLVLDARRRAINAPAVRATTAERSAALPTSPPPLILPPAPLPQPPIIQVMPQPAPAIPAPRPQPQPQIVYVPQAAPQQPMQQLPQPPQRTTADPALVIDTTAGDTPSAASGAAGGEGSAAQSQGSSVAGGRVRAAQFANRTNTVPQGTLVPAVLETGFDSTRPGLARAMVTADVRGFDGKRVLIQRGSRLIGEYKSEASPGQNRALINWFRLIRPDGTTIAIGSPAGDPLGRGGIKAKVDNHFFQRFAGAILQSSLDVGVALASRAAGNSPVIVALPGTIQNSTQSLTQQTQNITPTLRVRPGTSITIFVARDLDFTGAENRQ